MDELNARKKQNNGSISLASVEVWRVEYLSKIIGTLDVPQTYQAY